LNFIYGYFTDIYAFGVILFEILFEEIPWKDCRNNDEIIKKIKGGKSLLPTNSCGKEWKDVEIIMKLCLGKGDQRGTFEGIEKSLIRVDSSQFQRKRSVKDHTKLDNIIEKQDIGTPPLKKLKEEVKPIVTAFVDQFDAKYDDTNDRSVFVGRIPDSADESTLRDIFEKYGGLEEIRFIMKKDGTEGHRGAAFVQFKTVEAATAATAENGTNLDGNSIRVAVASSKVKVTGPVSSIFIGNLSHKTDAVVLRKFFAECGNITRISIPLNEDGKSKGFAFIDFDTDGAVGYALKFNEIELDGRAIRIYRGGSGGGRHSVGVRRGGRRGSGYRGGSFRKF
jgi:RNA recognition motif-containing protein